VATVENHRRGEAELDNAKVSDADAAPEHKPWMDPTDIIQCRKGLQRVRASQAMYGSRTLSALATDGAHSPGGSTVLPLFIAHSPGGSTVLPLSIAHSPGGSTVLPLSI
jgi:hypothetical protein